MAIVTGKDARIYIASGTASADTVAWQTQSWYAISDFALTFARGTVEQPLVGETGNFWAYGALAIDGSYTNCRFAVSGSADDLYGIINGKCIKISGNTGSSANPFKWYFASCQVTGFDVKMGDANTITNAAITYTVMFPYLVTYDPLRGTISDAL